MGADWLQWAQRLQALAATGCHFGDGEFDRERYEEIHGIATAMLADLTKQPIERVATLLDGDEDGYVTPKIDVRVALLGKQADAGKILLVQEKSDGRWTMPGGYADVGLSASENAAKEFREEAGVEVEITQLYCLRHKAKHSYRPDIRDFYKLFFLCECADLSQLSGGLETNAAKFFPRTQLPPLSEGRVIAEDIELAFTASENPRTTTLFD